MSNYGSSCLFELPPTAALLKPKVSSTGTCTDYYEACAQQTLFVATNFNARFGCLGEPEKIIGGSLSVPMDRNHNDDCFIQAYSDHELYLASKNPWHKSDIHHSALAVFFILLDLYFKHRCIYRQRGRKQTYLQIKWYQPYSKSEKQWRKTKNKMKHFIGFITQLSHSESSCHPISLEAHVFVGGCLQWGCLNRNKGLT